MTHVLVFGTSCKVPLKFVGILRDLLKVTAMLADMFAERSRKFS